MYHKLKSMLLLSGPLAVGKTAVRDILVSKYGFVALKSSRYLLERAQRENLPQDRAGLQDLGDRLDVETEYHWVIDNVAFPAIEAQPEQNLWLFDAVRKASQVMHFRDAFENTVLHVHFTAPESCLKARYLARQQALGVAADPTSYEVAIDHDNERSARSLGSLADLILDLGDQAPHAAACVVATNLNRLSGC